MIKCVSLIGTLHVDSGTSSFQSFLFPFWGNNIFITGTDQGSVQL
jgi:hypothetical protein